MLDKRKRKLENLKSTILMPGCVLSNRKFEANPFFMFHTYPYQKVVFLSVLQACTESNAVEG